MPKHIPRQCCGVEHTFQAMHGKPLRAVLGCEAYVPGLAWESIQSSAGDVKYTPQALHGNSRERTQPLQNFKIATFAPEDKPASIEIVMGASRDNLIGYLLGDSSVTVW